MPTGNASWTMDGFLGWAFGARTLDRVIDLVTQARHRVSHLAESPDDWEVRHQLSGLLRRIRQEADERLWRAEADLAGSLARVIGSRRFEPEQQRRLAEDFRAIERLIADRVAHQETLRQAAPAPAVAAA
jgi:hypothetical protein